MTGRFKTINKISEEDEKNIKADVIRLTVLQNRLRIRHKIYMALIYIISLTVFSGISILFVRLYKNNNIQISKFAVFLHFALPVIGAYIAAVVSKKQKMSENNHLFLKEHWKTIVDIGIFYNIKMLEEGINRGLVDIISCNESDDNKNYRDMKDITIKSFNNNKWEKMVITIPFIIKAGNDNQLCMYPNRIEAYISGEIEKELMGGRI